LERANRASHAGRALGTLSGTISPSCSIEDGISHRANSGAFATRASRRLADGNVVHAAASADADRDVGNTSRYPEIDVAGRTPCTCDAIDVHPHARARGRAIDVPPIKKRSLANREARAERCASLFARAPVVHQSPRQPLPPSPLRPHTLHSPRLSTLRSLHPALSPRPPPRPGSGTRPENVSWYTNSARERFDSFGSIKRSARRKSAG